MYDVGFLDFNFWLVNNFTKILAWFCYFAVMLIFVFLEFIVVNCTGYKSNVLTNIRNMFFFGGTILFTFLCSYSWGFTAMSELRSI